MNEKSKEEIEHDKEMVTFGHHIEYVGTCEDVLELTHAFFQQAKFLCLDGDVDRRLHALQTGYLSAIKYILENSYKEMWSKKGGLND